MSGDLGIQLRPMLEHALHDPPRMLPDRCRDALLDRQPLERGERLVRPELLLEEGQHRQPPCLEAGPGAGPATRGGGHLAQASAPGPVAIDRVSGAIESVASSAATVVGARQGGMPAAPLRDQVGDPRLGRLGGDAHGVLHHARPRPPVRDDADPRTPSSGTPP